MYALRLVAVLAVLHGQGASTPKRTATGPSDPFKIEWYPDDSHVTFDVSAPTTGYIVFGFSPDGKLRSSDLVIGWVDDNSRSHFHDCHCPEDKLVPVIDRSQDYQLLSATENDTHTYLRFRRLHDTCDYNDFPISKDTMRLVFLWHDEDPTFVEGRIVLPGGGVTSDKVAFISTFIFDEPKYEMKASDDVVVWKVPASNFSVPSKNTTYWCSIHFMTPEVTARNYIGYNLSVPTGFESIWHHMSFFHCYISNWDKVMKIYNRTGSGGECFQDMDVFHLRSYCKTPMLTWALGSRGQALPDDVSMPLDKSPEISDYFLMEVHYNNPTRRKNLVDNTVLNIYLTQNPRPKEATQMQVATDIGYRLFIPPNQKQFLTVAHCPSECTSKAFPPDGVRIFAVGLHTHLLGRKLRFRHFRKGKELPVIIEDNNYDFKYQELRHLDKHVQVLPGDSLTVECTYDSTAKTTPTFGGFPTSEEMCLVFPFYYPQSPLINCVATASEQMMNKLLGIGGIWMVGIEAYMTDPRNYESISVKNYLQSLGPGLWQDKVDILQDAQWKLHREGSCGWRRTGLQPSYMVAFPSEYPSGHGPYNSTTISGTQC